MAMQDDIQLLIDLLVEGENADFGKAADFVDKYYFQDTFENQFCDIKDFFASYWKFDNRRLKSLERQKKDRASFAGIALERINRNTWNEFNSGFLQRWKLIFRQKQLTFDRGNINITKNFSHLKNIDTLILKDDIDTVPESILYLPNLKSLALGDSKIKEFPAFLSQLQSLERLYLTGLRLSEAPNFIGQLKNLKSLSLSGNYLRIFPKFILQLKQLEELYLGGTILQEIPSEIDQLQQLKTLYLNKNQLEKLPDSIGNLKQLEELRLEWNGLQSLPKTMGNLKKLRGLYLRPNREIKKKGLFYALKYSLFGIHRLKKKDLPIEVQQLAPQCYIEA